MLLRSCVNSSPKVPNARKLLLAYKHFASCHGGIKRSPPLPLTVVKKASTSYGKAGEMMESLVSSNLKWKADKSLAKPRPTLLCFEMNPPVYTCGRREVGNLSANEIEYLKHGGEAEFVESLRGGQTTFHGPGQLVAYPVVDLMDFGLSVRCYVDLLEKAIIATLQEFGIASRTTENTGVWIDDDNKIAAIGIHIRRGITSHGIALNVRTDMFWFDRIVACGLPDKRTTSMKLQGADVTVDQVADKFAEVLAAMLQLEGTVFADK